MGTRNLSCQATSGAQTDHNPFLISWGFGLNHRIDNKGFSWAKKNELLLVLFSYKIRKNVLYCQENKRLNP
jgi:hypothetical protein